MKWKVVWNTSAQVVGRAVGAGTTLVVSLIIARGFGAEGYGDFAKITTYVALFYLLADFGMNAVYLQRVTPWSELLGVRVVGSVVLMVLSMAILVFLPQGVGQGYTAVVRLGIILFLPTILFQAIITTANAQFQRTLRYDLATIAIIAGSLMTIAGVIGVIGGIRVIGVIGVVGVIGVGSFITAGTALFFIQKLGSSLRMTITWSSLLFYFTRSLPLAMTLIFNLIYFRADHLILTVTRSTAEVGIYGLAYKVFEFPLAIPTFIMNSVYPLFLTTLNQESGIMNYELRKKFRTVFLFMILASSFMIPILWFAAPFLTHIRPEFGQSTSALRVLSLGLPFFFLTSLTMWTLIALKRQTVLAVIYGGSMMVNVMLNAWLVPMYGYMAAAWVTVGSEALVLIVSGWVLICHMRQIGHMRHI